MLVPSGGNPFAALGLIRVSGSPATTLYLLLTTWQLLLAHVQVSYLSNAPVRSKNVTLRPIFSVPPRGGLRASAYRIVDAVKPLGSERSFNTFCNLDSFTSRSVIPRPIRQGTLSGSSDGNLVSLPSGLIIQSGMEIWQLGNDMGHHLRHFIAGCHRSRLRGSSSAAVHN